MLDVAPRFIDVQRTDVTGRGNALAELLHFRTLQDFPEFRLAHQEALQQRLVSELEIGQHAKLFDGLGREVLRLVDDQQATLSLTGLTQQKGFERDQQFCLRNVFDMKAKRRPHHAQCVFGAKLGGDELPDHDVAAMQAIDQRAQNRRLASADLAGDDDETFVARHTVFEIGLGAAVLLASEIKAGVGIELERFARQSIERFVHGQNRNLRLAITALSEYGLLALSNELRRTDTDPSTRSASRLDQVAVSDRRSVLCPLTAPMDFVRARSTLSADSGVRRYDTLTFWPLCRRELPFDRSPVMIVADPRDWVSLRNVETMTVVRPPSSATERFWLR